MESSLKRQRIDDSSNVLGADKIKQNDSNTVSESSRSLVHINRIESSIFGTKPSDDFFRHISAFLYEHAIVDNLEIEGKLGIIYDKNLKSRVNFPVLTETILAKDVKGNYIFKTDMSEIQHKNFNKMLNSRFCETQNPKYFGSKIGYSHTKEIDTYYNDGGVRIRVTRDQVTGEILGAITKKQISHLDIYSPKTSLDFRISINQEIPVEVKEGLTSNYERRKDRISYSQDYYRIDLTKVISAKNKNTPSELKTSHELEVEIQNTTAFKENLNKAMQNQPNKFNEIVQAFIGNLKVLAKNSI
ncbi:hypothetical protein BB561_000129 [Smittium simulii]|uniref:mRNA-capping enzyme subunit beta n=1 Tax=Smittium simulii TaxID=133385 RepID=A0A2T9Z0D3_9FUNG|nr:hypothetical protein BB561_000129 [Smittium simulii]